MKRLLKIKNALGGESKYMLIDEYDGFGIYQEKTTSDYFVYLSWIISDNDGVELVIQPYNHLCKEKLLELIDSYRDTGKFGVNAVMHCGSLHMHNAGKPI